MDPANFLQGMTRETTIRRDAEGRWFYDGELLEHPNLTRAFDRWLSRADDGRYCLKNDINWAYITLEGAPLFVRNVHAVGGRPMLALSNDTSVPLALETLRSGPEGALYCDVPGDVASTKAGTLVARFDRHAASQLEPWLGEDGTGVYIEVQGQRVRPAVVSDPLKQEKS
jgi:hypothetical protein